MDGSHDAFEADLLKQGGKGGAGDQNEGGKKKSSLFASALASMRAEKI